MTITEIQDREEYLKSIPMGPERWTGEYDLKKAKAACEDYKCAEQEKSFREWLKDLARASKDTGAFDSEESRASYYEGQAEIWVDYYDEGETAEDAVSEDMSYWDED